MDKVNNQIERARELLAAQYRDGDLEAFIDIPMAQIQDIEDALFDIYSAFDLSSAVGVQLDALGRLLALGRGSSDVDPIYRVKLAARLIVMRSRGTLPDVLSVFQTLVPSSDVVIIEYQPATFTLEIVDMVSPANAELYSGFLAGARSAGVRAILLWTPISDEALFTFTSLDDDPGDTGWSSSSDPSLGGILVGAINS